MSPRIEPVPAHGNPPDVQELLDGALGGGVANAANIFRTMANHPGLMRKFMPYGGKLLMGGKLSARDRELVILRTAYLCRSDYEWGQHLRIGAQAGLSDEEMVRITNGPRDGAWDEHDALLLRATDEIVLEHELSEGTWNELAAQYDKQQLIELTLLAGNYAMLAGMLNSVKVERDEGVQGFPDQTLDQRMGQPPTS
jgi:4-carboxymuconolactone decarboxylase